MQVHKCMIVDPITVSPKSTSAEAVRLLGVKKLPALPVVDEELGEEADSDVAPGGPVAEDDDTDDREAVGDTIALTGRVQRGRGDDALDSAARVVERART